MRNGRRHAGRERQGRLGDAVCAALGMAKNETVAAPGVIRRGLEMIGLKTKLANLLVRLIARLLRLAGDEIMRERSREMDARNEEIFNRRGGAVRG